MGKYDIIIRSSKPSDAAGIARTQVETWRDAYVGILRDEALVDMNVIRSASLWADRLNRMNERSLCQVALFGGRVIGYCYSGEERHASGAALTKQLFAAEVYELYVDPSFQGRGLGTALFLRATERLEFSGFRTLLVMALKDNRSGCDFYEKFGGLPGELVDSVVMGAPAKQRPYRWDNLPVLQRRLEDAM